MTKEEVILLAEKVVSGTATDAELLQYNQLFNAFQQQGDWNGQLLGDQQQLEAAIRERLEPVLRRRSGKIIHWNRWAAAAAVALVLGTGYYLYQHQPAPLAPQAVRFRNDIPAPAGNHAVLTLGNGQRILLDSAGNGTLVVQGQVSVSKNADGQITYAGADTANSLNTIQVPNGSKPLAILLGDGTKVWIDAGSTLTYPASFHGKQREVAATGQAYFEVKQNAHQPFLVTSASHKATIEVLGTAFNFRAFGDERKMEVTLVNGAVKVNTPGASQVLHPGEAAAATSGGSLQLMKNVDIQQATAWKEGLLYFDGADITTIMSTLQRYYNIDVVYQTDVKDFFVAKIPRDVPVSQLLNLLEMTNLVHFKIEGRKITVIK
ncbi:FecR family protein [Chitinophaga polysaccharea]|uniref:FecR family protein n=1 Tax=Chitinophaga polysaccharea TaxID=1293035 RepID=A0A561PC77_9BACT|nr:FecR family protein [Chitinophaga polysaccharea]TWF35719.1 FecR family protein [Chitinophaga polysaccharea]